MVSATLPKYTEDQETSFNHQLALYYEYISCTDVPTHPRPSKNCHMDLQVEASKPATAPQCVALLTRQTVDFDTWLIEAYFLRWTAGTRNSQVRTITAGGRTQVRHKID